jgi:hypothetical protein
MLGDVIGNLRCCSHRSVDSATLFSTRIKAFLAVMPLAPLLCRASLSCSNSSLFSRSCCTWRRARRGASGLSVSSMPLERTSQESQLPLSGCGVIPLAIDLVLYLVPGGSSIDHGLQDRELSTRESSLARLSRLTRAFGCWPTRGSLLEEGDPRLDRDTRDELLGYGFENCWFRISAWTPQCHT